MERNRLLKKAIISFEEYERLVKDGVQKDILEQRIDKAIEYIEEHYNYENFMYLSDEDTDKLLEILKGEDKE